MGKGLSAGMMDMIGFGADAQESLMGPGRAGVVLKGFYKNPGTVTTLDFAEDGVSIDGCGKLSLTRTTTPSRSDPVRFGSRSITSRVPS